MVVPLDQYKLTVDYTTPLPVYLSTVIYKTDLKLYSIVYTAFGLARCIHWVFVMFRWMI